MKTFEALPITRDKAIVRTLRHLMEVRDGQSHLYPFDCKARREYIAEEESRMEILKKART